MPQSTFVLRVAFSDIRALQSTSYFDTHPPSPRLDTAHRQVNDTDGPMPFSSGYLPTLSWSPLSLSFHLVADRPQWH